MYCVTSPKFCALRLVRLVATTKDSLPTRTKISPSAAGKEILYRRRENTVFQLFPQMSRNFLEIPSQERQKCTAEEFMWLSCCCGHWLFVTGRCTSLCSAYSSVSDGRNVGLDSVSIGREVGLWASPILCAWHACRDFWKGGMSSCEHK